MYAVGTALFSLTWAVQIVRLSLIAVVVTPEMATPTMAVHQTATTAGYIIGPMVWYVIQKWRGSFNVALLSSLWPSCDHGCVIVFDRFSLLYLFNAVISGCGALMSVFVFRNCHGSGITSTPQQETSQQQSTLLLPKLRQHDAPSHDPYLPLFTVTLFSLMAFLFGSSTSIVRTSFQTLLVNMFHFPDSTLAVITLTEALAMTSIGAILSQLSSRCSDGILFLVIATMQLVGMALFLPLFHKDGGGVGFSQVMAGVVLSLCAGISFAAVCVSLMAKRMGKLYEQKHFGIVWAAGMLGMAASNWLLGSLIVDFVGSWMYALFMVPIAVVLGLFWMFIGVVPMRGTAGVVAGRGN